MMIFVRSNRLSNMLPLISVTVTPHNTDTQFLQAHCVAADPAGVGTTGAQSTVTHDRPADVAKPIIDY